MDDRTPIACSLSASEMSARLVEMAEVGRASLRSSERIASGVLLRFDADPEAPSRLAAIVAAERECCAFLTLDLQREGDELTLSIETPPEGRPILDEIVSAFGGALPALADGPR